VVSSGSGASNMGTNSSDLRGLGADQVITLIAEYFHSRNMSLSQAFAFLDRDGSQDVTWDEFVRGINLCLENSGQYQVSTAELWPIFKRFDKNGDDRVSIAEFSAQFYPARRGSAARTWYEEDMRLRGSGTQIGYGPTVYSSTTIAQRRVDDVLGRIASAIVRTGFSPVQLFQKVDLDRNGRLSWTELEQVILSFQQDLSVTERQAIFRRFDADQTGDIDINEFCRTLDQANGSALIAVEGKISILGERFRRNGQTVADAFQAFDRNFDGLLTRDEWVRAMRTFAWDLSDAESDAVFRRFDVNGDGYMNIAEFDTFFKDAVARCGNSYNPGYGQASTGLSYAATPSTYGVMPVYVAPPAEEPWEMEVLDTVRSCLSVGRSGMTITDVFRRLDYDHSQTMSPIEFQRMVTAYRPDLTAAHVDSLFRKVNTSNTGQIVLSEFIRRFG